jgi:hypothetical protein
MKAQQQQQQQLEEMTAQLVAEMQSKVKDLFPKETGTLELLNKENKKLRQQISAARAEGIAEAKEEIAAAEKERMKRRAEALAKAEIEKQIKAAVASAKAEYFRLDKLLQTAKAEAKATTLAKATAMTAEKSADKSNAVKPTAGKPTTVKPAAGKPTDGKPTVNKSNADKSNAVNHTKAATQRPTRSEELALQGKKVVATTGNPKKPAEIVAEERKVGTQKTVTIALVDGSVKTFGSQSQFRNWKLANKAVPYQLVGKEVVAK